MRPVQLAAFVAGLVSFARVNSQTFIPSNGLPEGSCTATIPCANGACCNGESGFCGFGPDFCGSQCTSHCDALAECGDFAAAENRTCPLNVCCSKYGFCGQTAEFCTTGCQSNCNPAAPVGGGGGVEHRRIGYYEGWAPTGRLCDAYPPEQIAAEVLTHVNFAFALVSSSFEIIEMSPGDVDLWVRTTSLKRRNSALKVWLSIGGWSFNDPPTQNIFSELVGSAQNTQTFITSAIAVMTFYGFDGIDIDWEYPAAYDRGGVPADKENYVTFMRALRSAFGTSYGISFTAPSSYWYLQHFDVPALLTAADFVNIMTYDLHGTWDGTDPYIGAIVLAHTNLTEIKTTLQLFQNVFTSASQWRQVNIGIGFYGRSFQLADPECSTPGCPFVGPAAGGPCTNSPGTLSYAEIMSIISANNLQPVLDEEDAVNYIVYDTDSWVSYDDAATFKLKIDYLQNIVGGSMIWSVDQDTPQYNALNALYPDVDYNNASSTETNQCKTTGCGESCPDGWLDVAGLTTPAGGPSCPTDNRASLCCPLAAVPQHCVWTGGGGSKCSGQCGVGKTTLALDPAGWPDWPTCATGTQALCCDSGTDSPLDCYATSCGDQTENAPSGYAFMTHVRQGSSDNGGCESENQSLPKPQVCPTVCSTNNKPVLCSVESSYSNCGWFGTPPACTDAACPVGYVSVFQDVQGDASTTCTGKLQRSFCCQPSASEQFLPVPENYVIPVGQGFDSAEQPASFTADFDDNTGPSDPNAQGAGSTGLSDDGVENDSPFGEVFITSPNSQSVSSLAAHSDWVLVGCDAKSDQPQSILAYCSMSIDHEESGCSHVLIGDAQHTVVRMPKTCGAGPYSRIHSFEEADEHTRLPAEHTTALPTGGKVYRVSFDYNFAAIPDSNGPIYMRADLTDMPGYWDAIVSSAPDNSPTSKRELLHMKRNFHSLPDRRWFGSFGEWLNRLNTLTSSNSVSRNFHWSDTYTIYHAEESCPNFQSSLDVSIMGAAQANSEFGYYLEATVIPPAIQQAYVYMNAGASASATLTVKGLAKAEWSSDPYELISFGFPGLSYPGLLTLGPSLHLSAQLSGELSLEGQFSATVGYTFPSINYAIGSTSGGPTWGSQTSPTANNQGFDYNFNYNVELSGGVTATLSPSLQLGLTVLGGAVMDANVYVTTDLSAGVAVSGSVSSVQSPQVCIQPSFGVNLHGGVKGSVLFWSSEADFSFYKNTFDYGGACFSSGTFSKRNLGMNYTHTAASGSMAPIAHDPERIVYSRWEKKVESLIKETTQPIAAVHRQVVPPRVRRTTASLRRRAGIPYLPGNLLCPAQSVTLDPEQNGQDCLCYSDADSTLGDNGQDADVLARRAAASDYPSLGNAFDAVIGERDHFDNGTHTLLGHPVVFASEAKLRSCNIEVPIPAYAATNIIAYYEHEHPDKLDPSVGSYVNLPVNLGGKLIISRGTSVYAREHVYEQSMSSLFVDYLAESANQGLWQNAAGDVKFCEWVKDHLQVVPAYNAGEQPVLASLGQCYPGKTAGLTPNMVILEQTMNAMKNVAFQYGQRMFVPSMKFVPLRSDFSGYCSQKQVAILRAAAGIPSYLNDFVVQEEFLNANTCIRDVWVQWYNAYQAANVNAPGRASVNVPNIYDNFVQKIMANIKPFLVSQITSLIEDYDDYVQVPNSNKRTHGAPPIDLSFYVLMDDKMIAKGQGKNVQTDATVYASNVPVSMQDLKDQILSRIDDVALVGRLPTH